MTTCSVKSCDAPSRARGLCWAHYHRLNRYGDPLGTKAREPSKVQLYLKDVVLAHSNDECLLWPFTRNHQGYGQVRVQGRLHIVSRLVCETINGPPPSSLSSEAAHSCGNGHLGCVAANHLSWKTHAENMADMVAQGGAARGERHGLSKLSDHEVSRIRRLKGHISQRKIAADYGVSQSVVWKIHSGKIWRHL